MIPGPLEVKLITIILLALINLILIKKNKKERNREEFRTIDIVQEINYNIIDDKNEGYQISDRLYSNNQYNYKFIDEQAPLGKKSQTRMNQLKNIQQAIDFQQYLLNNENKQQNLFNIQSQKNQESQKLINNQRANEIVKIKKYEQLNNSKSIEPIIHTQNLNQQIFNTLQTQTINLQQIQTLKKQNQRNIKTVIGIKQNHTNYQNYMDIQQYEVKSIKQHNQCNEKKQNKKQLNSQSKSQPSYQQQQNDKLDDIDKLTVQLKNKKHKLISNSQCYCANSLKSNLKKSFKRVLHDVIVSTFQQILENQQIQKLGTKKKKKRSM